MMPEDREEPPRRQLAGGQRRRDPEALGGVVEGEADHEDEGERRLAGRRRLPDREAFREVVEAEADRRPDRDLPWRRGRGRVRPADPPGQPDDREQSDGDAGSERKRVHREVADRPLAALRRHEGGFDRLDRLRQDVPEEEQDHAARAGGQERLGARREPADPPDRQAEIDREPGDRREDDGLLEGQRVAPVQGPVACAARSAQSDVGARRSVSPVARLASNGLALTRKTTLTCWPIRRAAGPARSA